MDEISMLQDRYNAQPSPSPQVVSAARAQLLAHATESSPNIAPARQQPGQRPAERAVRLRSRRWSAVAAAGLAAIAAIVAVALTLTGTTLQHPHHPGVVPTGQAAQLSASQILLAAAITAARSTEGSGTYWYAKWLEKSSPASAAEQSETWTRPDGETWERGLKGGKQVVKMSEPQQFGLSGVNLTFRQLQHLPARPRALKAWVAAAVKNGGAVTSAGRPDAAEQRQWVFESLLSLIGPMPTPPKVRAAAFREIAFYPEVKSLGPVRGGQGLQFPVSQVRQCRPSKVSTRPSAVTPVAGKACRDVLARMVIDPATSKVVSTNFLILSGGGELWLPAPGSVTFVTGWVDHLPR